MRFCCPPTTKDVIYKRYGETDRRVFAQGGASKFIIIMPDATIRTSKDKCISLDTRRIIKIKNPRPDIIPDVEIFPLLKGSI